MADAATGPIVAAGAREGQGRPPWWLVLPALAGAALAILPLGYLLVRTFEAGPDRIVEILGRPGTLALIGRSLGLAAVVTGLCLVIGIGLAALVTRTAMPARRSIAVLAPLPLAIPSYVAAFAWVAAVPWARGWM